MIELKYIDGCLDMLMSQGAKVVENQYCDVIRGKCDAASILCCDSGKKVIKG